MIRRKELSPVELVTLYLDRIEKRNPAINAYLTVAGERALEDAQAATVETATGQRPFHGVPISLKDLTETAGIRTTHGTATWAERVPGQDDEVVTRLRAAGFIVLGKTNTPEFGMASVTEPTGYPPCRNPWNLDRTPGGSSGGAAASLAAGLCPIAQGSDGGGSIRIPSSLCGVYGIKPSRGRVSAAPHPQHLYSTFGPMARTVADAAALLDVMEGYATGDAWWAPPPARPFLTEASSEPRPLRVAVSTEPLTVALEVGPAQRDATMSAAKLLAELGHGVDDGRPPFDPLLVPGVVGMFGAELAARVDLPPLETLDEFTRMLVEVGQAVSGPDVARAREAIADQARRTIAFFEAFDVLLTPTLGIGAPRIGEFKDLSIDQPEGVLRYGSLAAFTAPFNLTGQPAVSVPAGVDNDGVPLGIQLVGRPGDEATLIQLSAQLERAMPWIHRRPAVD
jgi:amidase